MRRSSQTGFTLVEVIVATTVLAIIGVTFFGLVTSYFINISRNNELSNLTIDSQNLLRTTVENIRFGNGVETQSTNPDNYAPNPPGYWSTSTSTFVIVIPVPALNSSTHQYIIDQNGSGSPYMNELVYYKQGNDLMERTLIPQVVINGQTVSLPNDNLVTTCPPSQATTTCPPDKQLAQYVNTMTFGLFDQDADAICTAQVTQNCDSEPVTAARSIEITLNMQENAPGAPLNLTTSTRVTLRNRF